MHEGWRILNGRQEIGLNHALFHEFCVLNACMELVGPDVFDKEEHWHEGFEVDFYVGDYKGILNHDGEGVGR